MAYDAELFMEDDPRILLRRFADYVEPYPAKKLAKWFGCTEKTADNFRRGLGWPNARHWRLIVQHFGRDVLAAVFEPEIDETLARLRREERELRERLYEIEKRRLAATGGLVGLDERHSAIPDRAALEPVRDLFEGVEA